MAAVRKVDALPAVPVSEASNELRPIEGADDKDMLNHRVIAGFLYQAMRAKAQGRGRIWPESTAAWIANRLLRSKLVGLIRRAAALEAHDWCEALSRELR